MTRTRTGGWLHPLLPRRWGAPVVGFVAFLPFFLCVSLAMLGLRRWFPAGLVVAVVCSLRIAAGVTTVVRDESNAIPD